MKTITFCLTLLCLVPFGSSKAREHFSGSPIFGRGSYWELGSTTLVQTFNTGLLYSTNRLTAGNNLIKTELHRQDSWMQRAYIRNFTAINENWSLYAMYDVAQLSYTYTSREYFSDGNVYQVNRYTGNNPSRSVQQSLLLGGMYKHPLNERLSWRIGGGAGMLMGIFEEEMPWLNVGFTLGNWTSSFRLATQWEAGIDWQLSKKHNNLSLTAGYVFHHAFANNENIIPHHLATHHGFQLGFRFRFKSSQPALRRSEAIKY